ncbi:glycosyltransferase family 2 protein [Chimaeribacter arupi]|uniref:Glycosyltransferase n=1 Tax=Chimaeribacter arupi TaxID=2060066 RepID=A0A2N5EQH0_9GAMM|nr:glycosyltransferase family 2 protein [Chimaeribacter arupi]PLR51848.1 glycosyltransferase [Chimaeribacter arupi]
MNNTGLSKIQENILPSISIIVPCYNENDALPYCLKALSEILFNLINSNKISKASEIVFVDDGSTDDTWEKIKKASLENPFISGIKLSRNRGHQNALIAGLSVSYTDVVISIDADLQDDIRCIEAMLEKYNEGNDIVYGVRNDRSTDGVFKRNSAKLFYAFMRKMGVNQVSNHADYRLMSRKAVSCLLKFKEQNMYIRGVVPLLGFKSSMVYYSRDERIAGESKYPLKKMLSLAIEGITSLTITPLRMISAAGFITCLISIAAAAYALIEKITGSTVEGWASVIISIIFLGGIQLLCLGVIGEYIGKIYMESKARPRFFIEEKTGRFNNKK